MGKSRKNPVGFGQYTKLGIMAFSTLLAGAIPTMNAATTGNVSTTVQQSAQDQKQAPITNPIPIRAQKRTVIGTAVPRRKKLIVGTIPQNHAKRHTNRIHASRKAKRKHRRA